VIGAVQKCNVGRRCTTYRLAAVAGRWLTGARHRGVGFRVGERQDQEQHDTADLNRESSTEY
jgi:hypothetical protein